MIIFGVDPGTVNMGISIYHIDDYNFNILKIETLLLNANNVTTARVFNNNIIDRLHYLDINYRRLLEKYNPVAITIENPFINRFRPGSVIPLAKNLALIEESTRSFDESILIVRVSPSEAKNAIRAMGNADKNDMYEALKQSGLLEYCDFNIDNITEHEIDAIAIAYSLYVYITEFPHLLL